MHFYKLKNDQKCLITHPVPGTRVGNCLGPEGNGVSSGEGGEGGPGPPNKEGDKQSTPSEEGGNMEQEEEGRKSQV
jgi:hypothetical protein